MNRQLRTSDSGLRYNRRMTRAWLVLLLVAACQKSTPAAPPAAKADDRSAERAALIAHIRSVGIKDENVLRAVERVPRHELVPDDQKKYAYEDRPLPIGEDQTISQPSLVAYMTELSGAAAGKKVLEIGTGSGYQAAILAETGARVYSIEIVEPLAKRAAADLRRLGYGEDRIALRVGDGYRGWPEAAPFDAVIVTAAPPHVPQPLKDQLATGGKLVIPVGEQDAGQDLVVITRNADGTFNEERVLGVRFVPMTGEAERE